MNKRVHSRFTMKKSEKSTPDKIESYCSKKNGKMLGATKNSTGEDGSIKSGKAKRNIPASRNLTTSSSIKRPNPYRKHSSLRNPKSVKLCQENLNKNVKQINKRAEFLKAKALENKNSKVNKMKSVEKKLQRSTTREDEKYENEKRKSEITGKLKRFRSAKSARQVQLHEDAGDIAKDKCESLNSNENDFVHDCSPGMRSNKSYEIIDPQYPNCSEDIENSLQQHYWDNMIKLADEQLQKSNDLVEIIRNMSVGNVDTETFLLEWKKQVFQNSGSIEISQSLENLRSNILIKNERSRSKDLLNSRNKYTLLEPIDINSHTSKSIPDLAGLVHLKSDPTLDDSSYSVYSMPDEISDIILNLNERTSNEEFYLTEPEKLNESSEERQFSNDEIIRVVESDYQLSCDFCTDEENLDDVNVTIDERNAHNKDIVTENNSESDEINRTWQCNTKTTETVKNAIDDVICVNREDDCKRSSLEDLQANNSELDDRMLSCFITVENEVIEDSPRSIDDNVLCLIHDFHVPRTSLTHDIDVVNHVHLDTHSEVFLDESTSNFMNISDYEQVSKEVVLNINANKNVCDGLMHDVITIITNENIPQCDVLTSESEQYCRCHEDFNNVELKEDVYFGKYLSSHTVSRVSSAEELGVTCEGSSVTPNRSCTVQRNLDCSELKQVSSSKISESVSDLSMENVCLEKNTSNHSLEVDERIESYEADAQLPSTTIESVCEDVFMKNLSSEVNNSNESLDTDVDECLECSREDVKIYSSDESVRTHPSSLVNSTSIITSESIATECINDEYLHMLLNEHFDTAMATIEDFQLENKDSIGIIPSFQRKSAHDSEEFSDICGLKKKESKELETRTFESDILAERSSVGIRLKLKEPYHFAVTPLIDGNHTNSFTILTDAGERMYELVEKNHSHASLRHELLEKPSENIDQISNLAMPISMTVYYIDVMKHSSLHGLIGVSAAVLIVAVGVLYFGSFLPAMLNAK